MKKTLQLNSFTLFFFIYIILISGAFASSHSYEKLGDVSMEEVRTWEDTYFDKYSVSYKLFVENGVDYSLDEIRSGLKKGAEISFSVLSANKVEAKDCRVKDYVELFLVKYNTLNDPNRFPDWSHTSIIGLYDPVFSIENYATITLVEQPANSLSIVVVHEAAHYWYDRFCLERKSLGDSEDFALNVEIVSGHLDAK